MCGITGIWWRQPPDEVQARMRLRGMCDALGHRGPDDHGLWTEGAVGFGHRRLSIVDLSPLGHQPMESRDGRFVICFNGEIFNFGILRDDLAARGHAFRGGSDTEVMLAAIQEWGLAAAVERFVGMFAFALWDRRERAMHLVRDRLGIKPLFVARTDTGDFVFGSELKAIMAHPGFTRRLSPEAVSSFVRYAYVPAPATVFRHAIKLLPGHILSLTSPDDALDPRPYWTLEGVAATGQRTPFLGDAREAEDELDTLLREAVALRMIADVPLGAFLSGGIDSSLVVALMQAQSSQAVRTFTIGFAESRYDESAYARGVAAHLGTDHHEQRVTADEARTVIPKLPAMYDEPLADASQIPTYLVSALARQHVTVALSGDGGDELFGGYSRYAFAPAAWNRLRLLPRPFRLALASGIGAAVALRLPLPGGHVRASKMQELLQARGLTALYHRLVSSVGSPGSLLAHTAHPADRLLALLETGAARSPEERMMLADTAVYLPDDLLTKLDRATMAVGLEGRVPLLDHRVVEFAWRLPLTLRRRKSLLRAVLARYVPPQLFDRPKMGFELPISGWLRGPLRRWADEMLDPVELTSAGVFDAQAVRRVFSEHLSGKTDAAHVLWSVLMFEAWRKEWNARL